MVCWLPRSDIDALAVAAVVHMHYYSHFECTHLHMNDLDNVAIICKFGLVYKTTQTIRQVGLCSNVRMFLCSRS